jgi:hypothetical protein
MGLSSVAVAMVLALVLGQATPVSVSTTPWLPGPTGIGDPTFTGTIDQPTGPGSLSGWVVDTSAEGWSGIDDVQLFDGLMGAGGQMVAHPTFQQNRPDVAASLNNPYWAASGWSATISSSSYGPGSVLYVYAHTPSKGWWYEQVNLNLAAPNLQPGPRLDVEAPTPLATVHNNAPYTIHGSAYDLAASAAQGTGVDRVQVYLNGDRQSGIYIGDATLGQPDPFAAARGGPQFAAAGWSLQFQPDSWLNSVIDNTITPLTIYARSSVTGQETKQQLSIVISIP